MPVTENKQSAQMIAWLDEERRKDKAIITRLEERTTFQAAVIEDQAHRIQTLEGELSTLRSTLLTVSTFDETIGRLRREMTSMIEQAAARREAIDQDLRQLRDLDREAMTKALEEMRQEMLTRIEREQIPRRAEEERLSRVATELQTYAENLNKGLEEFERSLAFLEEQRRQDSRRISDLGSQVIDLAKRVEGQQAKITLLEDLSRRNGRTLNQLSGTVDELKQHLADWTEAEGLAAQQRERMMVEMERRMNVFASDMDGFAKQVGSWAETHRAMKTHIEDFERLTARVERRLNEVAEVQRLSEERFRQEWEEFNSEDQKRWRQFTLTNEEAWNENNKRLTDLQAQATLLTEEVEHHSRYFEHLIAVQQEQFKAITQSFQSILEQLNDGLKSLPSLK